jgi:hypothetical protein
MYDDLPKDYFWRRGFFANLWGIHRVGWVNVAVCMAVFNARSDANMLFKADVGSQIVWC